MRTTNFQLSRNLKAEIARRGLSLEQFAGLVSCHRDTISRVIQRNDCLLSQAEVFATALTTAGEPEVNVLDLIGYVPPEPDAPPPPESGAIDNGSSSTLREPPPTTPAPAGSSDSARKRG